MNHRPLLPLVAALALCLVVAACSSSAYVGVTPGPDRATVNRAASLAFGKAATCGKPDGYGEYTCTEHPPRCGVQTDGWLDGSVANAGCWQTICDVELGVETSHGETGTKDFYYCERVVAGCSSMTGGCPGHDVCITGHGRKLAVDDERTTALPDHGGGEEFSCPYHGEG
jgi:hypothetical protein